MEIDGSKMEFGELARAVLNALTKSRYPPLGVSAIWCSDDPPENPTLPKRLTKITVSPWMMMELRYRRHDSNGLDMIMQDWCDGQGPRVRWFGIVCDIDEKLPKQTILLS
jgi:hypothetical protein